jgi:hypothetical protein
VTISAPPLQVIRASVPQGAAKAKISTDLSYRHTFAPPLSHSLIAPASSLCTRKQKAAERKLFATIRPYSSADCSFLQHVFSTRAGRICVIVSLASAWPWGHAATYKDQIQRVIHHEPSEDEFIDRGLWIWACNVFCTVSIAIESLLRWE